MFKSLQVKGHFSLDAVMSPEGRIGVIFSSFELLELSLSLRVTRGSNGISHSEEARSFSGGLRRLTIPGPLNLLICVAIFFFLFF